MLPQVQLVFHLLLRVNQFCLATVRRTKVLARLLHQMCLGACLLQHLQVCYAIIALTLVTANCMFQSLSTPKIAKCGFLLPSSSVTISDLDRLLGEGVTLCGHACLNTTCSLESVLKGGADC